MYLGPKCRKFSIVHEFLHALGFLHMQATANRDDYVTINWDNIKEGHEKNFKKVTAHVSLYGTECE